MLRVRKDYGSRTMSLEQSQKELGQGGEAEDEEEHLSISQLPAREDRVELAESVIPLPLVDP